MPVRYLIFGLLRTVGWRYSANPPIRSIDDPYIVNSGNRPRAEVRQSLIAAIEMAGVLRNQPLGQLAADHLGGCNR